MANYKNISWKSEDLQSSKNALKCIYLEYGSIGLQDAIETCDFGILDVFFVLEEIQG